MKHLLLNITAAILLLPILYGQQSNMIESDIVAIRSFSEKTNTPLSSFTVKNSYTISNEQLDLINVYNFEPRGFIIISLNKNTLPVLAYSAKNECPNENQSPEFSWWMEGYKNELTEINNKVNYSNEIAKNEWNRLTNNSFTPKNTKSEGVEPLIKTKWNQDKLYNAACPEDSEGPGGHALAGCVATTLGQIMCYFRHPEVGNGSYSYTDENYGTQSVDFSAQTYNYDLMPESIEEHNNEVAKLLYHIGVSVDMNYGPTGSGMTNHSAAFALKEYFDFTDESAYIFRDSIDIDWNGTLMKHLDQNIPIYYAGWSDYNYEMGHAFVCDGYQDSTYFHFNWGWGGIADGYFNIEDLSPSGNDFRLLHEAIINAVPKSNYPHYFSGTKILTQNSGFIDDGSGPINNYKANNYCEWLIDTQDSVAAISLDFFRFNTLPEDKLIVYNGSTTDSEILVELSGNDIPDIVKGNRSTMLITFESKSDNSSEGFQFKYNTELPIYCLDRETINTNSGTITDGSLDYEYLNNTHCLWKILLDEEQELTFHFNELNTEIDNDYVRIYDSKNSTIVGEYSGSDIPEDISVTSDAIIIIFHTNNSTRGSGFELEYGKPANINSQEISLNIYPNPAKNILNIKSNSEIIQLDLLTVSGKQIYSKLCQSSSEQIDTKRLNAGIYLLKVLTQQGTYIQKVIIND